MGEDTQKIDKQSPIRSYLERRIGHAVYLAIPTGLLLLAGWIWSMEGKIAGIDAQWKVLYENRERLEKLRVEVEVYKRLSEIMINPRDRRIEIINNIKHNKGDELEPKKKPIRVIRPKIEKFDDFRQQQIRDMKEQRK